MIEGPVATFDPPGLAFFTLGATRLMLDRAAPTALLSFEIDDVRQRVEELRRDNVAIDTEPHVIFVHEDDSLGPQGTEEWMALIRDSEGNTVGLVSHRLPSVP
jgi:methylmalonyl-CoA/ethylmalonyl-CoA epimerase